jgi:hypothetical protein
MELEDDWATFQPDVFKRSLRHADRTPFFRPIRYDLSQPSGATRLHTPGQMSLSLNFGPSGLCMLTDGALLLTPKTIVYLSGIPADRSAIALGEVCWIRSLPRRFEDPCLVGVKVHSWGPGGA